MLYNKLKCIVNSVRLLPKLIDWFVSFQLVSS